MTCKILHVSDTHLGNRQYGSDKRRADFAIAFQQAIDVAVERNVDAVVHTGDLFDSRSPSLPYLNDCIDILEELETAEIPFYAIVGNHERKMDDQFLDLLSRVGVAERLDKTPTVVDGEVALYGIDAVTKPSWHSTDFTLTEPPSNTFSILAMHQLVHPPVPEIFAEHPVEDILERVNIDIDGLAMGDYHAPEGDVIDGTKVWYAGSTERCSTDETDPRTVSILEIEDRELTRKRIELDTRPFAFVDIEFSEGDEFSFAKDQIDRHDIAEKVVHVTVTGDLTTVTASDIRGIVMDRGAAVCRVDDQRGGPDIELEEGPSGDVQSADRLIEEKLAEENLSEIAVEIEKTVRTTDPAHSSFDDEAEQMITEAQAAAFADEEGQEGNNAN